MIIIKMKVFFLLFKRNGFAQDNFYEWILKLILDGLFIFAGYVTR